MPNALSRHAALNVLVGRALLLLALVSILMIALNVDSPVGVALLVVVLGWIDLRRRRETLFWANLGYSVWLTAGVIAAVAIAGATLFATVLRPLVGSAIRFSH